jgi:hypothetical protein
MGEASKEVEPARLFQVLDQVNKNQTVAMVNVDSPGQSHNYQTHQSQFVAV